MERAPTATGALQSSRLALLTLALSITACATASPPGPQSANATSRSVATSGPAKARSHGADADASSVGFDLPARGARDADLTIISLLDPGDARDRALFTSLDLLQRRLGDQSVRWILLDRTKLDPEADPVLLALQERAGESACFEYVQTVLERAARGQTSTFPERLQIALELEAASTDASPSTGNETMVLGTSGAEDLILEVDAEVTALAAREAGASLLSIEGLQVRGLPSTRQLDEFVQKELKAVRALRKTGLSLGGVLERRRQDNAHKFLNLAPLVAPSPTPEENTEAGFGVPSLDDDGVDAAGEEF